MNLICTSVSLRVFTRVFSDFVPLRHSSPKLMTNSRNTECMLFHIISLLLFMVYVRDEASPYVVNNWLIIFYFVVHCTQISLASPPPIQHAFLKKGLFSSIEGMSAILVQQSNMSKTRCLDPN